MTLTPGVDALVVALSFLFGALDVSDNPKAPAGAAVTAWGPPQAEYLVYADLRATLPHAMQEVAKFRRSDAVRNDPVVGRLASEAFGAMDRGVSVVKVMVGVDLTTDLDWVAVWVVPPAGGDGDPDFLVAMQGTLPPDLVKKIGGAAGVPVPERDGRPFLDLGEYALGRAADGTVLFGATALVDARCARAWKPAKPAPGSLAARVVPAFGPRPFLVMASAPGEAMRRFIADRLSDVPFLAELFGGHEFLGVSVHKKGVQWTWVAPDLAGVRTAELASTGLLDILRAGQLATRGITRLLLAGLHAYEGDPTIAAVVKNQAAIVDLVVANTGDGRFDAKVDVRPKDRTVEVRATADSFKRILPVGLLLPLAALGAGYALSEPAYEPAPEAPGPGAITR